MTDRVRRETSVPPGGKETSSRGVMVVRTHLGRFCLVLLATACLAAAASGVARAEDILAYTEGAGATPWSFVSLDPALTTGPGGDQALEFVLPVDRDLPFTSVATTGRLDMGKATQEKEFLSLAWGSTVPRGANVFMSYSVDGGAWLPAVGALGFDIPDGTHGKTIAYRVTLTTSESSATPSVRFVTIEYTRWTGRPTKPPSGGGGGSSHQPGATHKPGSGSYTYPPAGGSASAPSWGGGSSGGTGGLGGTTGGSGSAGGSGSGSGSGSGASAAQAQQAPMVQAAAQPSAAVPSPPASAPVGPSQSVSGLPVDPGAPVVEGVPLEPVGASGAGSGQAPVAASAGFSFPVVPVLAVGAALAVLLLVPGVITASTIRRIGGHDLRRARLLGPFSLLKPRRSGR